MCLNVSTIFLVPNLHAEKLTVVSWFQGNTAASQRCGLRGLWLSEDAAPELGSSYRVLLDLLHYFIEAALLECKLLNKDVT